MAVFCNEVHCNPSCDTPCSPPALPSVAPSDHHILEARQSANRIKAHFFHPRGIHNNTDVINGDGRLRYIRRQHHFLHSNRRAPEDLPLLFRGERTMQRQDPRTSWFLPELGGLQKCLLQCGNLLRSWQEDEHSTMRLPCVGGKNLVAADRCTNQLDQELIVHSILVQGLQCGPYSRVVARVPFLEALRREFLSLLLTLRILPLSFIASRSPLRTRCHDMSCHGQSIL
mmetsp:Transcript_104511/g.223385  ORF Transcript_104511/g.223385 Transcript_104511/m.223385 type:complete len:228 (+) Transcript_104511:1552-2235(+)